MGSQSGPSLWLDGPFRLTYDRIGRYFCIATPTGTFVWDAGSAAFLGCGPAEVLDSTRDAEGPVTGGSTPGFRCPGLRSPGFGLDAVAWQSLGSTPNAAGESQMLPVWRLGELPLD